MPRYEDFAITSHSKNPFEFLGMGWTVENRAGPENADCSPYLNIEYVDPKWYEAVGGNVEDLKRQRKEAREAEAARGNWIERRI